jgi:hypothetical protein
MVAAALTPTVVQRRFTVERNATGTPMRIVEYLLKITKVTQADWVVAATYCPGTYLGASGFTVDGSSDGAAETVTYTATGTKIVLAGATTGTVYLRVLCSA